jgi:L-rhamnose-H+ transport protein
MHGHGNLGAALVVVAAGLVHGSFALPMKKLKDWRWENIWLVYSVAGLIFVPALLAFVSVPQLGTVYATTPASNIALVAIFGFGWGLGSTLFGLGIAQLGLALGFAIILGITSSVGSLLPLLLSHPEELATRRGLTLLAGLAIAIVGIIACSIAGAQREKDQKGTSGGAPRKSFLSGLLICLASGILSPMLNFGFVYGKPLQDAATALGARSDLASTVIWVPALAGGFLANAGYAVYLLNKNKTWSVYGQAGIPRTYWVLAALMGLMWFGGIAVYGIGAAAMGSPLGAVVGWPAFMSMVIVTANLWGALTGEWAGAGAKARTMSWTGVGILILAIAVIAQAS